MFTSKISGILTKKENYVLGFDMQTIENLDSLLSNDIIEQNYNVDLINNRTKMVSQLIEVTAENCGLVKTFHAQGSKKN